MIRCDDADLLMLAHGALEGRKAAAVRIHAAVCPACRARLRRFEGLSASLAGAFRNPSLGTRTFGRSGLRWASAGLLAAALLLCGGLAASNASSAAPSSVRSCPAEKAAPTPNFCPLHRDR